MTTTNPFCVGLDTASNRWHAVSPCLPDLSRTEGREEWPSGGATVQRIGDWDGVSAHATDDNPDVRRAELALLFHVYLGFLPRDRPVHVFCEEPLVLQNGKTSRLLALAAGALWAQHLAFDLFWHWVDVAQWKKMVIGRGNADKAMIRMAVSTMPHGANWPDDEPDLFDAHALSIYGRRSL